MKVLVTDNLNDRGVQVFVQTEGIEPVVKKTMTADELMAEIAQYDAIVIRSGTKLTAELIEAADNLKVIGRAGIGVDNIDVAAATRRGVVVMNTPGGNTVTTAEHAIAMMFSLVRHIPQATSSMRQGKWEKKKFVGFELFNKTLGIVGLGNIGQVVASRALGLRMKVVAFDPFFKHDKAKQMGVELVEMDELLARSHVISVHVPKSTETHHLLGKKAFAAMRDGAYVINCARGGIVDEAAMLAALESGKVAGAGLDVFESEPPGRIPLLEHEHVICTPHLGASTEDAQVNVAVAVAQQVAAYLTTGEIANALNFPAMPAEAFAQAKPYIRLAEQMGRFVSLLATGKLEELSIDYSGQLPLDDLKPVTIAAIKGVLEPALADQVNFINAPVLAEELGLQVREGRTSTSQDFVNLVTLRLKTSKQGRSADGTIFGKLEPRIVRFDDYRVELDPTGHLLIIRNDDQPGVVGAVGTLLAQEGINIAGLQLGRDTRGGRAISVIHVDEPIDKKALRRLQALDNVIAARCLTL